MSCRPACKIWWRVRAYVDSAEPGRVEGVLPAVGPQRVGPGREDGPDEGAVLLWSRRSARPGRDRALDRRADPGGGGRAGSGRPGSGAGGRGARSGVRRVPSVGRGVAARRVVAPARDRPPVAPPRDRDTAGSGGGAGAVRAGGEPGAGAVLEAGRDLVGGPRRARPRPGSGV